MRNKAIAVALVFAACVGSFVGGFSGARAADTTSFCKWPYPWPRTVTYYIDIATFGSGSDHVQYGGNTWTEANFNLLLERDYYNTTNPNFVKLGAGDPNHPEWIAYTTTTGQVSGEPCRNNPSPNPYWTIYSAHTIFSSSYVFNNDCLAAGQLYCASTHQYDLHDVSAHEFSHWFYLFGSHDVADQYDTFYYFIAAGEVNKRDLTTHDLNEAWIMYGCRNGGSTYFCI